MAQISSKRTDFLPELCADLYDALLELRVESREVQLVQLAEFRMEFRSELQRMRAELIRWMFGFWVTTLIGIAGLLIALHRA